MRLLLAHIKDRLATYPNMPGSQPGLKPPGEVASCLLCRPSPASAGLFRARAEQHHFRIHGHPAASHVARSPRRQAVWPSGKPHSAPCAQQRLQGARPPVQPVMAHSQPCMTHFSLSCALAVSAGHRAARRVQHAQSSASAPSLAKRGVRQV